MPTTSMLLAALLALQGAAALLLLARLARGRTRRPPVEPILGDAHAGAATVTIATLDEARRVGPCLAGLERQGAAMARAHLVDSRSTDGTWELLQAAAARDPRLVPMHDPPLPAEWVGKVWALQHGLTQATTPWVLGMDADTEAQPGLVAAAVDAAERLGYDAVSFSPRFDGMTVAEQWLQPAMLCTLVYRFGPSGDRQPGADRVMANGQCFLAKREVLLRFGGYESARRSWCDDVTLARHLARNGCRVGFLDGSKLYTVRAYDSIGQMWREWGRSIDLKDATTPVRQWLDVAFVVLTMGVPLPALVLALAFGLPDWRAGDAQRWWVQLNAALVAIRVLLLFGLAGSYARRHWTFWLSWTADPVAALRIVLSTLKRPR
ncbi:MAG: glycosyltransferase, partial [Gemmatimonadaceae bacterium]|nr:glycosyltransferase [Gemmatimonadaceae bacterium]